MPGEIGKLWPRWAVERRVPGDAATEASAIVVNVTGVETRGPGYLTVSAARRSIPGTSNVNWMVAGAIVPNHVITPITATHGFQVFACARRPRARRSRRLLHRRTTESAVVRVCQPGATSRATDLGVGGPSFGPYLVGALR